MRLFSDNGGAGHERKNKQAHITGWLRENMKLFQSEYSEPSILPADLIVGFNY